MPEASRPESDRDDSDDWVTEDDDGCDDTEDDNSSVTEDEDHNKVGIIFICSACPSWTRKKCCTSQISQKNKL